MEFNMPEAVSAMRGLALPSQPFKDTPLVVTAPRAATSTKSWYSMPAPKVPEAGGKPKPGKPSKKDILGIEDKKERMAAIAANIDLFK